MISEPANSILVIFICIVGALHFGGVLGTSKKSPALAWMKTKHPHFPNVIVVLLVFVALIKIVGLF
ncbi:hypothetical protein GCM10010919_14470 [Alishewanella longhuensis]|uniref:Uncharacterized protein n=1 Tax=Alishewanella longhuensis TaxID=1091037 RepID=A0ABQ3KWQ5_9ALTE|nr:MULTISPECIES: hypothetical protein [Gammaproteobacteria]GHG66618.1 hypothetical protein GCM10010919_14470 [Alishewanella longhuensis]